ncbi:MAG: hypothetical protein ACREQL_13965 [Candidatus Binatia bacterium]
MRTLVVTLVLVVTAAHAGSAPEGWTTYRSEQFGWELSYPPEIELKAYFGGQSAELRDWTTGAALAELELWPSDLCPRERPGTTAEAIGMERVAMVTQADGDDGSSSCGTPMTVRRFASDRNVPLYEVRLTCSSERIVGRRTLHRREGRKGPTFFANVSQSWRKRVLTVDPVGIDPRMAVAARPPDVAAIRDVLATLATFAVPDPNALCIEDLRPGAIAGTLAVPPSRK